MKKTIPVPWTSALFFIILAGFIVVPAAADAVMEQVNQSTMFGGDYKTFGGTKEECKNKCLTEPNCRAAVYGEYAAGPICWLKNATSEIKDLSGNPNPHTLFVKTYTLPTQQVYIIPDDTNVKPTASFTATPSSVDPLTVQFDASASSDPDGISAYAWDFGDNNKGQGKAVSHKYQAAGSYTVTLAVTDNGAPALTGTATRKVTVTAALVKVTTTTPKNTTPAGTTTRQTTVTTTQLSNSIPTSHFTADKYSGNASLLVAFDASGSSDTDGTITQYTWDFGDGKTGSGVMSSHVYETAGTYRAALTVTDNKGSTASAFRSITVSPPSATKLESGFPLLPVAAGAIVLVLIAGAVVFLWSRSNLQLVLRQKSVQADGASQIPVRVQFVNGFGQPKKQKADRDVEIKTTSGMIQNVVVPEGKAYAETSLRASREVGPVTVTARSVAKEVQGRVDFLFVPGRLEVTPNPPEIPADGRSRATVTIRIQDASGNGVIFLEDKLVQLTANLGTVISPVYVPARSREGTTTITAGETSGTATINAFLDQISGVGTIRFIPTGKRYCMHCGTAMRMDVQYCPECGKIPPSGVDTKSCAGCGGVLPQTARYCDKCGAKQL